MEAFPLHWPTGYKRTLRRIDSRFKQSMEASQSLLRGEVKRLGGTGLIVSTNLPLRNDGGIYSVYMTKLIDDPGVAVYFKWKGKDICMCCDQYRRVWENIYALANGIKALRDMSRWGVSDFLDRAFNGFAALPEATDKHWSEVLGVLRHSFKDEIKEAYRKLAKIHHPDRGGDQAKFQEIQLAYQKAMAQWDDEKQPNLQP